METQLWTSSFKQRCVGIRYGVKQCNLQGQFGTLSDEVQHFLALTQRLSPRVL